VPSSDPIQRFHDILDNIARIERFTAGLNVQTFRENEQALFAVQHALLIISEAAAKLGNLASELCPDIPWRDIRGLGNRLRHEYHSVDVVRLWTMIERDLAPLKAATQAVLQELDRREE
jgi:uncharacterized protein with HEPN domain